MKAIEEIFEDLIAQHGSFDIAEHEFKKMAYEDNDLRDNYRLWCEEHGYKERSGFIDYCHKYIDEQDEKLHVLNDEDFDL